MLFIFEIVRRKQYREISCICGDAVVAVFLSSSLSFALIAVDPCWHCHYLAAISGYRHNYMSEAR